MLWQLIKTLRPEVIVIFLISWNVLVGIGMVLNGGMGQIRTLSGAIAMAITCGGLAAFGFCTALVPAWQRVMFRPEADPRPARLGLIIFGIIGAILAIVGAVSAVNFIGNHT